jgi:hypothetical protein
MLLPSNLCAAAVMGCREDTEETVRDLTGTAALRAAYTHELHWMDLGKP